MELIKQNTAWFFSEDGCRQFASLKTLDERSIFLYSYLRTIVRKSVFEKKNVLFKTAFFLADAVMESALPYNTYPALIDPQKNPFVAYLSKAWYIPNMDDVYYIYLAILHKIANPANGDDWIYDRMLDNFGSTEYIKKKLKELGKCFLTDATEVISPEAFAIEEPLQLLQLKLIWLFDQST